MTPNVSHEARLRYRQRVRADVASAVEAVHQRLRDAEEIETPRVTNARVLADDEAIYVLDEAGEAVQTVLARYDEVGR